jgi:chromosomal replication initiator protein
VVGGNNDFAYSAASALAKDGTNGQNALYLLSKTGLGKSHLSQAIGNKIMTTAPRERVYYVTAEDFAMEMIHAYQQKTIGDFKQKYRNHCDVLLLEDIHFLTGKERTQIELSQVLDYMYESGKKIIFSSCYLPADIPKLSDQLRSRLTAGLVSNIERPDFSTRVRILKAKARTRGQQIAPEVIEYLAGELSDDIRQLEAGLAGVAARAALTSAPVDLRLAAEVVKTIARKKKTITIDRIKKMVCKYFNVSAKDIVSRSRKQQIVRPRQIAIYLARNYTDQPLQAIGKSFNRQHATAIHAVTTIDNALNLNGTIKKQVDYLRKKLDDREF